MIEWKINPTVMCWTTDVEYRVVDLDQNPGSAVVIAVCGTLEEAQSVKTALRAFMVVAP